MKILVPDHLRPGDIQRLRDCGGDIQVSAVHVEPHLPLLPRVAVAAMRRLLPDLVFQRLKPIPYSIYERLLPRREAPRASYFIDGERFESPRHGVEVLLATWAFDAAMANRVIDSLPDLRWVHSTVTGVDHLPLKTLAARGIVLTSPRSIHAQRIAEFVLALIYADAKNLFEHAEATRLRRVQLRSSTELADITLGIVGFGAIGQAVARLARTNGIKVIAHVRGGSAKPAIDGMETSSDLARVLKESDVALLALPLTRHTHGMIGAAELRAMKPGAMLINVGRGETVVEQELARSLNDGHLRRVCLDVVNDPVSGRPTVTPPVTHPLYRMSNVIFTGYSASESKNSAEDLMSDFVGNLLRYLQGQPLKNQIDLGAGY